MFGLIPYRRSSGLRKRDSFWDIGSLIEDFFNDSLIPTFFTPINPMRADVKETENEYIIDVEVPGARKEDIKLELKDDILNICIERNEEVKEERSDYIRRERRYGSCSRSFYVPDIKHEGVKAKYNNGVLTITLPKADEIKGKKRTIDVE
ncbi:MAG: Hsp20/alpha crystallin family protein [Firmicutes bacterium]|nr:Hsp20/alpha crystallin family protein [Bacillota bacterium]